MNILVTAASKHGSTAEIAEAVASTLRVHGHDVVVCAPERVVGVSGFDCVVIGSALYTGGWVREARQFVGRFASDLQGRWIWLFSSGPVGDPMFPATQDLDIGPILARTGAYEHVVFPGRLVAVGLTLGERLAVRAAGVQAGDYRDWDAVRTWAERIDAVMSAAPPVGAANTRGRGGSDEDDRAVH
ncbi:flavodoxin domain-containing protein [Acidothermaceae bacterium B102]|nr:flavodoxin domain-containing protein [Acidothermaceae bacterium B102]